MSWLYDFFISPLSYEYMQHVLLSIIFICTTCGLISTFLVLKGWSLYGDALSHAVLPGIIIALSFGFYVGIGVFTFAIIVTFTIQYFNNHTTYSEQTVLSMVTSAFMGIGFLLYYAFPPPMRITEILFGKIVGQTTTDVIILACIALAVVSIIFFFWKTFALVFFDRVFAQILGIRIFFFELVFYAILAIAVMTSLRTVGSLLVVSLLILPGSLGYVLTKELKNIFFISTIFSVITGVLGMYLSYHYAISTGAAIITMQFTGFLIVFLTKYQLRRSTISSKKKAIEAQHAQDALDCKNPQAHNHSHDDEELYCGQAKVLSREGARESAKGSDIQRKPHRTHNETDDINRVRYGKTAREADSNSKEAN